jgi:hypothetical protein
MLGENAVGGLSEQHAKMKEMGVPPMWTSYVAVEDADATAKRVTQLGGKVIEAPFDVMEFGRMAVLQDPGGAAFAVWQPKQHVGAGVKDDPGSVCWNELVTRDMDGAKAFYEALFGWKGKTHGSDMPYTEWERGEGMPHAGGGMEMKGDQWKGVPPHWSVYFAVDDVDASVKRAEQLKGSVTVPPTEVAEVGRFAVLRDPQGAVFSIIKLAHTAK